MSQSTTRVGVLFERSDDEARVALVPEVLGKVSGMGTQILVEPGAGAAATFDDAAYVAAGATLSDPANIYARADIIVRVGPPTAAESQLLRSGQVLIGLLRPWERLDDVRAWAERGVTTIALDYLPRTLSRTQVMDVLTSQASVAGYRAAIRAANVYGGYFPMLMTAAGTVKPAEVLVLGAGVAGLQAIATARRLGASVSGYDVRPAAREEVASLGAKFVNLPGVVSTSGSGGYARELTAEERAAQLAALDKHISRSDIVITTAQVPGRKPPLLVTAQAVAAMKPGSVVLDMAASAYGGNVEVSKPGVTVIVEPGVTVIGAGSLASDMAPAASRAYARNITALLSLLVKDGVLTVDPADEVVGAMLVTHQGRVIHEAITKALAADEGGTT
ncbi:MAG: NAD(P) transhydrogenase subunit alpha [Nakamurella sp.]